MHFDPHSDEEHSQLVLTLKRAIVAKFDSGDWKELGYLTGAARVVDSHPRLLRSLSWGDEDYGGCVFEVLEKILKRKPQNRETILRIEKIASWIKANEPALYQELYKDASFVVQTVPKGVSPRKSVETALKDAEALIYSSGAVSAVDRTHTALHGYLIALCEKYEISHSVNASVTELYKALRREALPLRDIDAHGGDAGKIFKALASMLDALNSIRNRGSIAHPNEELVGEAEAMLAINAARTMLQYLNARL